MKKKNGVTLKEMCSQKVYIPYIPLMITPKIDMKNVTFATKKDLEKNRCKAYKYLL